MKEEDLDQAFREGRLTRRAYVRQLIDGGRDMQTALARADEIVPAVQSTPPATSRPSVAPVALSERPRYADDLEVNFVGDGYIVYDRGRRRMHSLNPTAALVFELCTGENTGADIASLLQRAYELDEMPTAEVEECLASLSIEHLIR